MTDPTPWCFRVRAVLGNRCELPLPEHEWPVGDDASGHSIRLVASATDGPLNECRAFALKGMGYPSQSQAESAGQTWRTRLMRALATARIGADFGDRAPGGGHLTPHGREIFFPGQRVLDDVHGLMTFECDPAARFASMNASGLVVAARQETLLDALDASTSAPLLSDEQQIAYDFYSASFNAASADARFALLMVAVESMIRPAPRTELARAHVQRLIELTNDSSLGPEEITSINGSLKWLLDESISGAGRRLVGRLGPQTYLDEPPERFFDRCYDVRSRLFHVTRPLPTWAEVGGLSATLELLVADLITMN